MLITLSNSVSIALFIHVRSCLGPTLWPTQNILLCPSPCGYNELTRYTILRMHSCQAALLRGATVATLRVFCSIVGATRPITQLCLQSRDTNTPAQ